tara:strand:+ start:685 stop:813 length:129 start_codon:yes stop_codon:yes gene_type:complete
MTDENSGAPVGWKLTLFQHLGKLKAALNGSDLVEVMIASERR